MKQLTMRQAGMMLSYSMISVKFLVFPALLARFSGRDSYIVVTICFGLDLFFIGLILLTLYKFPNKTLKDIMTETYGTVVTRICFFVIFLYMFIKAILVIKEAHTYFLDAMFRDISIIMFILPFIAISLYIASKSLKTVGRVIEFVFVIVFLGILVTVIIPIKEMDLFSILPVLENGVAPIGMGIGKVAFSFGDQIVLMLIIGKIKYKKEKPKNFFFYALITSLLVICLNILFISLFESMAISQQLAASDIPLNSTAPITIGRLDWITIILWVLTLIIQSGVFMFFAVESFAESTSVPKNISLIIVSFTAMIVLFIVALNLAKIIEIMLTPAFVYSAIVVQVILPIMLFIATLIIMLRKKKRGKDCEKIKENI